MSLIALPTRDSTRASRADMASRLTLKAVDLGAEDDDDNPLSIAIELGNLKAVERSLRDGWPLHVENKMGYSPLQQAASDGQMEISSYLISRGADPNARNKWGMNALHRAAHNGHSDLVMLLLENGGNVGSVNDGGNGALHWGAYFGHYQVCTMLLNEGADPLLKNKKGITPLEHAKSRKKLKCERILRSYAEGKMKARKRMSQKPKTGRSVMQPITDADLHVESTVTVNPPTQAVYIDEEQTEVVMVESMIIEPGEEGEVVQTEVCVTESTPADGETKKTVDTAVGEDVTVVEAPFVEAEPEEIPKLEIGEIGEPPEPLDMGELEDEPSLTLLPLRTKRPMNHLSTPRYTPRMKMFTPMKGGTPNTHSRANSQASVASDRTVAYRNVDHKGDKLYSKKEITQRYKDEHQTMCLEMTALKAENMQLVKEGEVLTSEIQRLNQQWKTVRHENETVKYTVKEVMRENEGLKSSMSEMTLKMNKMNVDIDKLLSDNTRLSRENKKLNQDLMKELHFYKAKHLEEKQRAESLAISLQEQKKLAIDLEEQLALPPSQRTKLKEECDYKRMVLDFITTLNIPDSFKVPKFTKCFCKECCPEAHLEFRGQPLMMYAVPQHYVRFGIATDNRVIENNAVFERNHVSFYPIHPAAVRDMISTGLLLPGGSTLDGDKIPKTPFSEGKFSIVPDDPKPYKNPHRKHFRSEFRHPEKCNCGQCQDFLPGNFFFTSPTIKYVEHPNYRPYWVKYQGKMVRCAFQVRQKQDAYNILWRTTDKAICSAKLLDPFFRNDELEYFSADARNYVITGLCVSITDLPKAPTGPAPATAPADPPKTTATAAPKTAVAVAPKTAASTAPKTAEETAE